MSMPSISERADRPGMVYVHIPEIMGLHQDGLIGAVIGMPEEEARALRDALLKHFAVRKTT